MNRAGSIATAIPVALVAPGAMIYTDVAPMPVAVICGYLIVQCAPLPDWDHPNYKRRLHFGAWFVRLTATLGYMIRTAKDVDRADVHRGPSHCVEWCALMGLMVAGLLLQVPYTAQWAWWFGGAVALGLATHILSDLPTPSGVPVSAIYNYFVHGEVWKRHAWGWFATGTAGEYRAVRVLHVLSALIFMGLIGVLDEVGAFMLGVFT